MSSQSSSIPTSGRAGPPARCSAARARFPTKSALAQVDEPAEPDLVRRVGLVGVHRVACARVVDLEEDEPRVSSRTTSRATIPAGRMPYGPPAVDEGVPDVDRAVGRKSTARSRGHRCSGPADVDRRPRDRGRPAPEVAQVGERLAGGGLEDRPAPGTLEGEGGGGLADVLNLDVEPPTR